MASEHPVIGPVTLKAPELDQLTMNSRALWVNQRVLITKKGHPFKGRFAQVEDAIQPENENEKPKVVLQLELRNTVGSDRVQFFYDEVLDCKYVFFVVDASLGC